MATPTSDLDRVALDELDPDPHARVFGDREPRTVLLSLAAGERVAEHRHPGRTVVCHVLDGVLSLSVDGESHRLGAGDVVRFSGDDPVEPHALGDATALLVLAD